MEKGGESFSMVASSTASEFLIIDCVHISYQ